MKNSAAFAPPSAPVSVTILGATGTIGQNCLEVIKINAPMFRVEAVTANQNAFALAQIAIETNARFAAIADPASYAELKEHLAGHPIEAAAGPEAIIEAAARPSDVVVAGIVGSAGLKPTLAAVERGAKIALANKECLICAGDIFMELVQKHGATLLPVDSEHNGIFQILQHDKKAIESITLTASGGPFRQFGLEQMRHITPAQAVKHPNWHMGAKISVDSATMANKGLELIEAKVLFDLAPDKLKVLVHPQSIIHGLVSYRDGSVIAQLSETDMRVPLANAMGWPNRIASGIKPYNLADSGQLDFAEPDLTRFPMLALAREIMEKGGAYPTAFNAANEVAVEAFLAGNIGFLDIHRHVSDAMSAFTPPYLSNIEDVLQCDKAVRESLKTLING